MQTLPSEGQPLGPPQCATVLGASSAVLHCITSEHEHVVAVIYRLEGETSDPGSSLPWTRVPRDVLQETTSFALPQ